MENERWLRVEELFHGASPLAAVERAEYLARECAGDEELRREVESLLEASEGRRSFIERPALTLGLRLLSESPPGSLEGSQIGRYKVTRLLGAGGMGEVYLAEDTTLERPVALKFVDPVFADDAGMRELLAREARAVARLENSNICTVHSLEEVDGHNFIVMQYVEGETLASVIGRAPLGAERALDLAEQIAGALAAAHALGIVHRDVKPQNIAVGEGGQVKVLDFGLAKFTRRAQAGAAPAGGEAPARNSLAGVVVGTVAYMSPEQARGEELDCRSDVFSLGIVLCEMFTGRNPFLRGTVDETIKAIDGDDPPLAGLPDGLPRRLASVIRKCLAKDRGRRYETAGQLLEELRALRATAGREAAPVTPGRRPVRGSLRRYAAALALLFLLLAGAGFVHRRLSRVHTLAVLPIVNESRAPDADYLSEGLTRNLADKFSYLPRLRVKLPSVASGGAAKDPGDMVRIGRELKADAVITGQIFKEGEKLRLRVALLDAADAAPVWDATFDLDAADMFTLQDEITRVVTSRLGLWLVGDESRLLTKQQTDSGEALRLYMRGRYYWSQKRNRDTIRAAISHFERAIELDPSYAKAYSGLADAYALTTNVAYGPLPTAEAMEKARWAARQAIESDGSLPESHTSMGMIRLRYDWQWQEAEQDFKRAIELDPDYAAAHYWYSNLLAVQGRHDESVAESEVARGLDPYSPLYTMNRVRALYYARRHNEAAAYLRGLLEQRPDYPQYLHLMGLILTQQGRHEEAVATLEKMRSIDRPFAAAALGYAYGMAGRREEAAGILRELDALAQDKPVPPHEKALVYIGLGDFDAAFPLLNSSLAERFPSIPFLKADPIYDPLRPDPRFHALARGANLAP